MAIEQRLSTTVEYRTAGGRRVERVISGAPDVLIAPEHEGDPATVVDFKFGWGLPPEQEEHSQHPERGLSVEGYFQQRFYGLLVMDKYPALPAVQFNERYVRWGETRPATITREALEHVRREMAGLVKGLDRALMAGARSALWRPSPGKHCAFCLRPGQCPIEREARGEGAVTNARQAAQYAAERQVAQKVVKHRTAALRNWSDATGRPTPLKDAKGRRELGFVPRTTTIKPSLAELQAALAAGVDPATLYRTRNGAAFTDYTPAKSDRGPDDPALVEAMRKAVRA